MDAKVITGGWTFRKDSGMTDHIPPEGAVLLHLRHLHTRNCRAQTIYNRRRSLARLARWADGPILYLTGEQMLRWEDERSDQISPAARAAELSSVRQFFLWAVKQHLIDSDPTIECSMPRAPRRLPRPIADRDIAEAIARAEPKVAAIIGLAAFAGLRAGEIARLDWAEVGFRDEPPMIRISDGKGGHSRLVPLSPALADLLHALPRANGPVIPRGDGSRRENSPSAISGISNRYLHAMGIDETLHQARHRFGTTTYRACQDIRAVQGLMGHASITSTQIYTSPAAAVGLAAVMAASQLSA